MAWVLYEIPSSKRTELDAALKDDLVSRQSQKVREAAAMGGPSDQLYVLVEGSAPALERARGLLAPLGKALTGTDGEALYRRFKDEEEAASAGMGLFFTEG